MLGKVAQFGGMARFYLKRWRGGPHRLIEYKDKDAGRAP
jgi:hypothetical protein